MTDMLCPEALERRARSVRRRLLRAIHHVGTGHPGSSLSAIEILVLLYFRHLCIDADRPELETRDRVVFSKGHAAPALYAVLAEAGYFREDELYTLRQLDSRLHGHPIAGTLPGVDATTGSLGQGLSVAVGLAKGLALRGLSSRVFCVLGDGELQEGQNWEAAASAVALGLTNLVAIVDRNGLQNDGPTEEIMPIEDVASRFTAFGWHARDVAGHDISALDRAIAEAIAHRGPGAVIARTVKGKGVSFMEGVVKWHHHTIDDAQLRQALAELDS